MKPNTQGIFEIRDVSKAENMQNEPPPGLLFGQHGVVLKVSLVACLASGEPVSAPRGGEFDFAVWLHDSLLMND